MIPYIEQPIFEIGTLTISGFKVLLVTGLIVGYLVAMQRLKKASLPYNNTANFIVCITLFAFIFSHLFATLLYHPARVWADPLILLNIFKEMSSFGGMAGGILGGIIFLHYHRMLNFVCFLKHFDVIAYAFPFGWMFGRAGCAIAHDHPGVASSHWLAVQFPSGSRFDLGLLELLLTVFIAITCFFAGKQSRPPGFFIALFIILYAPARFAMDSLRTTDVRYLGWTPGQYIAVLMTAVSIILIAYIYRSRFNITHNS